MTSVLDRDISKLPKWAQQRISILERRLNHLESVQRRVQEGDTDTWLHPWGEDKEPLPPGTPILFLLSVEPYQSVRAYMKDGYLNLNAEGGAIVLRPRGGVNVASVDVEYWTSKRRGSHER